MNAYTLEQQEEQDNEQYSDIAYKSHIHELFLKGKARSGVNNPEPDWRDAYKQDYLTQNPQ